MEGWLADRVGAWFEFGCSNCFCDRRQCVFGSFDNLSTGL